MIPPALLAEIQDRLGQVRVLGAVGGGCVNPAVGLEAGGRKLFLKYNLEPPPGLFAAEADGLERLRAAAALRIPEVLDVGNGGAGDPGWILLEWLDTARPTPEHWEALGRGLARLHRVSGGWGLERDGYIGPLPQHNGATRTWAGFWQERRLEPQLRRARDSGAAIGAVDRWDALSAALPSLLELAEAEGGSLLHGDLWSGNVLALPGRDAALVDPAAYHGHREVDLAMAALFGGFGARFRSAYEEEWPLQDGAEIRMSTYQLYYLLVHVNLFGGGYAAQTRALLDSILSRL